MKIHSFEELILQYPHTFHIALNKLGWSSQVSETYHILAHAAFIPSTNTVYNYASEFRIPCLHIKIHCLSKHHPYFVHRKCLCKAISTPYLQSLNYLENGKLQPNVYFFGILMCDQYIDEVFSHLST